MIEEDFYKFISWRIVVNNINPLLSSHLSLMIGWIGVDEILPTFDDVGGRWVKREESSSITGRSKPV